MRGVFGEWTLFDAIRCTSAAPTYAERYVRPGEQEKGVYYIDGAMQRAECQRSETAKSVRPNVAILNTSTYDFETS